MPKAVESLPVNKPTPKPQPKKAAPKEQSDSAQTFEQALTDARPKPSGKPAEKTEAPAAPTKPGPEKEAPEEAPAVDSAEVTVGQIAAELLPEVVIPQLEKVELPAPAAKQDIAEPVVEHALAAESAAIAIPVPKDVDTLPQVAAEAVQPLAEPQSDAPIAQVALKPIVRRAEQIPAEAVSEETEPEDTPLPLPVSPEVSDESESTLVGKQPVARLPQQVTAETTSEPPESTEPVDPPKKVMSLPTANAVEHNSTPAAPAEVVEDVDSTSNVSRAVDLKSEILNLVANRLPEEGRAQPQAAAPAPAATPAPSPVQAPELDFAGTNHDRIVTSMRSELVPNGGTMRIRLDPPELGALQVTVRMLDGVMTASFETSTEQASKMLSHSLGQLKQVLETQGVSVERLHVQQSPRNDPSNSSSDDQQQRQSPQEEQSARQEQQRREMLRRLWRRMGMIHDPLDMVA